jgi:DNA-binding winged helix-turn-helix (wHTH) protein
MSEQNEDLFEFGLFVLDPAEQSLTRDGEQVSLPPKAFAVLLLLVTNAGRTITKKMIIETVWAGVYVEEQNLVWTIHLLRKELDDDAKHPKYIETKPRHGYRFIADVHQRKHKALSSPPEEASISAESEDLLAPSNPSVTTERSVDFPAASVVSRWLILFSEDRWFLLASCTLYALLYAVALLIEVACRFDVYSRLAIAGAPLVFVWVWTTSFLGLSVCRRLTLRGQTCGLTVAILVFAVSALSLYGSLSLFLPNVPITKALFPTYPAQGAYLKSIYYFFPLAVVFLVLPYQFIIAARNELRTRGATQIRNLLRGRSFGTAPNGTVFLRIKWLGSLLVIAAGGGIAATAHLLENLVPGEYTNFFTQLVQWRLVLYFSLGLTCLLWYSRSLNAIKIDCLKRGHFKAS